MRAIRLGLDVALATLLLLALALALALRAVPALTGLAPLTILTGSMNPALPPGSLIWIEQGTLPTEGEIATYQTTGRPVTHRVTDIRRNFQNTGDEYIFTGDATGTPDPIPVPAANVLGTVEASAPFAGYAAYVVSQPIGMALAVSVGLLLILARSWLPGTRPPTPDPTGRIHSWMLRHRATNGDRP